MCAAHLPVIVWRAKWMPHCGLCVVRHSFTTSPAGYVPPFRFLFITCLIKTVFLLPDALPKSFVSFKNCSQSKIGAVFKVVQKKSLMS